MEKCVQWVWRLQIMSTNLSYNAEITTIKSTQYIALTTFSTWTRVTGCHAAFPSPPVCDGSHTSRKGRQEFFICCLAPTNHVFVGHLQCTMFSPVHDQYLRFKEIGFTSSISVFFHHLLWKRTSHTNFKLTQVLNVLDAHPSTDWLTELRLHFSVDTKICYFREDHRSQSLSSIQNKPGNWPNQHHPVSLSCLHLPLNT